MYNIFEPSIMRRGGTKLFQPERLRKLRKLKKLTQEELAKRLNTTNGTVSNYENGVSAPNHDALSELANILETTTDYLLDRTDNPNPNEKPIPDFATSKDKRDFKKFLDQQEIMFDGVPLTDEDKARVLGYMEAMFWDAKKMNKRKKP
jgi:HTH-type transcriptional regulator, competence development regulator